LKKFQSFEDSSMFTILIPLVVVNLFSLFGFATFASNPDYVKWFPWAEPILEVSFPLFSRLQIISASLAMFWTLKKYCSKLWPWSFITLLLSSLGSELLGTSLGIPFGAYGYSSLLGFKVLGKVPCLIPLSWFYMSVASYALIRQKVTQESFSLKRVFMSALVLLTWDLVLDPAMSHLTPFWFWEKPGGYFGMPNSNLVGWFVTGIFLMTWLEFFKAFVWLKKIPMPFMRQFYLANLMLPLGMCVLSGLWLPTLLVVTILFPLIFERRRISSCLIKPHEVNS
jgi:uncharacterized membrane protein